MLRRDQGTVTAARLPVVVTGASAGRLKRCRRMRRNAAARTREAMGRNKTGERVPVAVYGL